MDLIYQVLTIKIIIMQKGKKVTNITNIIIIAIYENCNLEYKLS